jgi:hypothetical protein
LSEYNDKLKRLQEKVNQLTDEINKKYHPAHMASPMDKHPIPPIGWTVATTKQEAMNEGTDPPHEAGMLTRPEQFSDSRFRPDSHFTPETAIEFLTYAVRYREAKGAINSYKCNQGGRGNCQNLGNYSTGDLDARINLIRRGQQLASDNIQQQNAQEQLRLENIQANMLKKEHIQKERQTQLENEKRNKTLLLIGSLFLFG